MEWLLANKEWLFSGLGLVLTGWLVQLAWKGYRHWGGSAVAKPAQKLAPGAYAPGIKAPVKAWLPRFLLRARLSPADLQKALRISLRSASPIGFYLQGGIPHVDIYIEITNLGPIDLVLDRILLEVWFGQPAFYVTSMRREVIPAGEITTLTGIRHYATAEQKAYIEQHEKQPMRSPIRVEFEAYFTSSLGDVAVSQSVELPRP